MTRQVVWIVKVTMQLIQPQMSQTTNLLSREMFSNADHLPDASITKTSKQSISETL